LALFFGADSDFDTGDHFDESVAAAPAKPSDGAA
jgi:hypothetical protein